MNEKPDAPSKGPYALVRAFLKDFYAESKRGTLQHKKGVIIFLSFCLVCFVVVVGVLFKLSESPVFCGQCHNMKVYIDSWHAFEAPQRHLRKMPLQARPRQPHKG